MKRPDWTGVIPAITTSFTPRLALDLPFTRRHVRWLVDAGCTGIVTPGSLGEGSVLTREEKAALWRACVGAVGKRVPVIAAIAAASTAEAVALARLAQQCGCRGLMILPPYVYQGTWREMRAHFAAVLTATRLSAMLYNNPIAYGTDVLPEQVVELAQAHPNLHAVKESSTDVRRITALRALLGDRLALFVGVDDLIVEGIAAGACGWIAGLVNALPVESVRLFTLAREAPEQARALYAWFLPLLRMDTTYDFVQRIELVQQEVGMIGRGGAITRPPRQLPAGRELAQLLAAIRGCLRNRPRR